MRTWAILGLLLAGSAHGVTNGTAPATDEFKYDAVGAFAVSWRLGFDQGAHADDADHAWFCSATLVNTQQIQTGVHCLAPYGSAATYMVRFRRREDGGLGTVAVGVSSFFHARVASWDFTGTGNDDVAIGTLESPVYHITAIPLGYQATTPSSVVQAGWGRVGPGFGNGAATELLLCPNSLVGTVFDGAWFKYPSPDVQEYGYNSCGVNSWDSGGPAVRLDACGNPHVVASHISPVAGSRVTQTHIDAAPPDVFYRCPL